MVIDKLPSGEAAFRTNFPEVDERNRDEIITVGTFLQNASMREGGSVTPIAWDEENGEWTASKAFGGPDTEAVDVSDIGDLPEAKDDPAADQGLDDFATCILASMGDLHGGNVRVDENGNFGFFDLDHSLMWYNGPTAVGRDVGSAAGSYESVVGDMEYDDIPDDLRANVSQTDWEQGGFSVRHAIQDTIEERAEKKAVELVEETGGDLDQLLVDPDEGYDNRQGEYNAKIKDRVRALAERAREDDTS
jgi:hypothetical protein